MASLDRRRKVDAQLGPRGTALHITVGRSDLETINLLIDSGADINAQCDSLGSPLQLAVSRSDTNTIRALLARGADVDTQAGNLSTLLHIAAEHDDAEIINLLPADGSRPTIKSETLGVALRVALSYDNNAAMNALLSRMNCPSGISAQCGDQLTAALSIAADHENVEAIRALVENGAGRTYGELNPLLRFAMSRHRRDIVSLLKNRVLDIESLHGRHDDTLFIAVDSGSESVVKILLDTGARVDALRHNQRENVVSETALHAAVARQNVELARVLLDGGADIHVKRTYGTYNITSEYALHIAVASGHLGMIRLLLHRGADVDSRYDTLGDELHFGTALHIAIACDHMEIAHLLLDQGANTNALCAIDQKMLNIAVSPIPSSLDAMRVLLLRKNKESGVQSGHRIQGTALQLAAARCNFRLIVHLLEKGADIGSRGPHGETVLEAAMHCSFLGSDRVICLLLQCSMAMTDIWNGQDFGNALVAAAKTWNGGQKVRIFASFGLLEKLPQDSFLIALDIAVRGGTFENYDFARTLLPHSPKAAFATPAYDMLIKTADELLDSRFKQLFISNISQLLL